MKIPRVKIQGEKYGVKIPRVKIQGEKYMYQGQKSKDEKYGVKNRHLRVKFEGEKYGVKIPWVKSPRVKIRGENSQGENSG